MRLRRVVKQMKTLNSELTSAQIGDRLQPPRRGLERGPFPLLTLSEKGSILPRNAESSEGGL